MTKFLATASRSKVIFRKVTKVNRPLVMVYSKMYRIDDDLFCADHESTDSFILYDLDEQQPYGHGKYLNPDFTKVLIDSMKLSGGKAGKLFDLNMELIIAVLVVGIVIFSFAAQYLG